MSRNKQIHKALRRLEESQKGPEPFMRSVRNAQQQLEDAAKLFRGGEISKPTMNELDDHFKDAVMYGQMSTRMSRPHPKTPLGEYSDGDLIVHMLNRGYAVMKCPDGKPPEVLSES